MAGKALKDVTSLNKCSACGHVKRAHLLCPYCVKGRLVVVLSALECLLTLSRNQRHVQGKGIKDNSRESSGSVIIVTTF